MRRAAFFLPLLALACAPVTQEAAAPALEQADCYTVDLFPSRDDRRQVIAPDDSLRADWAAYSGVWGQGAWDGGQCHEIHITQIFADGSAVVMDTHAPFGTERATGFRRVALLNEDGSLTISGGQGTRRYMLQDGKVFGTRFNEDGTTSQVILSRQE
ncbi:hypothetical protein FHS89_001895 [Rubricella aquisinus]|uniref:Lipoprotein n=1 Tax=Rubricella aquisinus TaxID=2028108 RepID=A0A840X1W4_9RHOB|nr:hypothetical protein [Rubricella aquisinus]MBB5515875.1 hypothetical protein [Rubricella aquisinus]